MLSPREEAACVIMSRNRMYIMGGLIDKEPSRNTEVLSAIDGTWEDGFSLPEGFINLLYTKKSLNSLNYIVFISLNGSLNVVLICFYTNNYIKEYHNLIQFYLFPV